MEDFRVIYYDYARKNRNRISQQKSYDKKPKQVGKDKENAVVPPDGPLEEGDGESDHFSFDEYFE